MSGGSYNYAYRQVQDMADDLRAGTVLRKAFADHLRRTAEAMKAVEWVDSGDRATGDEDEPIRAAMGEGALPTAMRVLRTDLALIAEEIRETTREHTTAVEAENERLREALEEIASLQRGDYTAQNIARRALGQAA